VFGRCAGYGPFATRAGSGCAPLRTSQSRN
jgi:hypothetical protein